MEFVASGSGSLEAGTYLIPYQSISMLLLGPGTSITHDVFRLAARHGVLLAAVGESGVKIYSAPPIGQGRSDIARRHALLWANKRKRIDIARRLYAWRFGRILPHREISVLRGIEGARLKEAYILLAKQFGVEWKGRRYDRQRPEAADPPNQAINHAATFVEAASEIAVTAVGAIPSLGFIHEGSSNAFILDIADLYRVDVTLPLAFQAVKIWEANREDSTLEQVTRKRAASLFRKEKLISKMIDKIKELFNVDDGCGDS